MLSYLLRASSVMKTYCLSQRFFNTSSPLVSVQLPSQTETHFWYILPNEVKNASLLNQYLELLSPCERENVFSMYGEDLKKRALLARALVRTTIARYDFVIFKVADPVQLDYLWCIPLCFEAVSGLTVNLAKLVLISVLKVHNVKVVILVHLQVTVAYLDYIGIFVYVYGCGEWGNDPLLHRKFVRVIVGTLLVIMNLNDILSLLGEFPRLFCVVSESTHVHDHVDLETMPKRIGNILVCCWLWPLGNSCHLWY